MYVLVCVCVCVLTSEDDGVETGFAPQLHEVHYIPEPQWRMPCKHHTRLSEVTAEVAVDARVMLQLVGLDQLCVCVHVCVNEENNGWMKKKPQREAKAVTFLYQDCILPAILYIHILHNGLVSVSIQSLHKCGLNQYEHYSDEIMSTWKVRNVRPLRVHLSDFLTFWRHCMWVFSLHFQKHSSQYIKGVHL